MPRPLAPAIALLMAGVIGLPALADQTGPNWLPTLEVTEKLRDAGYTHVTELQPENDHLAGKGIKDGKLFEFKADPRTGAILDEKTED